MQFPKLRPARICAAPGLALTPMLSSPRDHGAPSPARSRAHSRRRRAVGILVRADQGRPARSAAVRAGRDPLFLRRRAAGVVHSAAADAGGLRRRLRSRDRRLPVRTAVPRHAARDAGRPVVAGDPGAGVLHDRPRYRVPRRPVATRERRRRGGRRAGVVLLAVYKIQGGAASTFTGLLLVLVAAFAWAVGNIVAKRAAGEHEADMFALVVWSSLVPPVPLLVASYLFEGGPAVVHAVASASCAHVGMRAVPRVCGDAVRLRIVGAAAAPLSDGAGRAVRVADTRIGTRERRAVPRRIACAAAGRRRRGSCSSAWPSTSTAAGGARMRPPPRLTL